MRSQQYSNQILLKVLLFYTLCTGITFSEVSFDMKSWVKTYDIPANGLDIKLNLKNKTDIRPMSLKLVGPLHKARVISNRSIDVSSMERIKEQIVRPGMSDREKAFAARRFCNEYIRANPGEQSSYDAIEMFNNFGGGYCGVWAGSLEAVASAIGLKSCRWEIGGHDINVIYYDDAWHAFDQELGNYWIAPDNKTVAGMKMLSQYCGLVERMVDNHGKRDGNYAWDSLWSRLAQRKEENEGLGSGGAYRKSRHDMRITLRENESLELRWLPKNWKWFHGGSKKIRNFSDSIAMRGKLDGLGSGTLQYQPNLNKSSYRDGVLWEENVQSKGDFDFSGSQNISPRNAKQNASLIWRIKNPYPYVSADLHIRASKKSERDQIRILFSGDQGVSFNEIYRVEATGEQDIKVDLMPEILKYLRLTKIGGGTLGSYIISNGQYSYMIKLDMLASNKPQDVGIKSISFNHEIQLGSRSLPLFEKGITELKVINHGKKQQRGQVILRAEQDLFSNRHPKQGDKIKLEAFIKNRGNQPIKNLPLRFYYTYDEKTRKALSPPIVLKNLDPGERKVIEYNYECNRAGELAVELVIDPDKNLNKLPSSDKKLFSVLHILESPILALNKSFISTFPKDPKPEDLVTVQVTVRNISGYVYLPVIKNKSMPSCYRCGTKAENVKVQLFKRNRTGKKDQLLDTTYIKEIYPLEYEVTELKWKGLKEVNLHDLYIKIDPEQKTGAENVPPVNFNILVGKEEYQKRYQQLAINKIISPLPFASFRKHPKTWVVDSLNNSAHGLDFEWSDSPKFKKNLIRKRVYLKNHKGEWELPERPKIKKKTYFWRFRFWNADHLQGPWITQQYTVESNIGKALHFGGFQSIHQTSYKDIIEYSRSLKIKFKNPIDEYTTFYASFDHGAKADYAINSPYPIMGLFKYGKGLSGKALHIKKANESPVYKNHNDRGVKNRTTYYTPEGERKEGIPCISAEEGCIDLWFYKEHWGKERLEALYWGFNPPYYAKRGRYLLFNHQQSKLIFGEYSKNGDTTLTYPREEIKLKQWYHVAGTWDKRHLKLYLNGNLIAETKRKQNELKDIPETFIIGSGDRQQYAFQGVIDEFRISKVARSYFFPYQKSGYFLTEAILIPQHKKLKTLKWNLNIPGQTQFSYDLCYLKNGKYVNFMGMEDLTEQTLDLMKIKDYHKFYIRGHLKTNDSMRSPEVFGWMVRYE